MVFLPFNSTTYCRTYLTTLHNMIGLSFCYSVLHSYRLTINVVYRWNSSVYSPLSFSVIYHLAFEEKDKTVFKLFHLFSTFICNGVRMLPLCLKLLLNTYQNLSRPAGFETATSSYRGWILCH